MTPAESAVLAARFPAFAAAAARASSPFVERSVVRRLPVGATYLREGDRCAGLALVLDGRIRVCKTSHSGRELTLYHIVAGETCILTASCLLSGTSYPALANVVEEVIAAVIPAEVFLHLFESERAVRSFVFEQFSERLAATMVLVEDIAFKRVDQRAARWLVESADGSGIIGLSHEEIADQLGTARVVVSRLLEDFQSRGWVKLGRRRVEIVDAVSLMQFSHESD